MVDQKPKHKPQKKRTLEEVLKSLQDLIRNDLVSRQPLHPSWREFDRPKEGPQSAAGESESFHQALSKLDQIIKEKIIEPAERAQETPPEPLLPDEELEIEWDTPEPDGGAGPDAGDIEAVDVADLDGTTAPLEEIELQPLAPDAASSVELPAEPPSDANLDEPEVAPQTAVPPKPTIEVIEAAPALPSEERIAEPPAADAARDVEAPQEDTIDLSSVAPPGESADGQGQFDFAAPPVEGNAAPPSLRESAAADTAAAEAGEQFDATGGEAREDSVTIELSEPSETEPSDAAVAPERPEVAAVESKSADAYTVEFTVHSKPAALDARPAPDAKMENANSARTATASAETASQTPDESALKKKSPPSDSAEHDKPPPEAGGPAHEQAPGKEPSIPVLKDVADLKASPAPPLPEASQARDIAIRVIARLNIERRKSGEKPLDIKTIERLQQYLADALNKRALNKK